MVAADSLAIVNTAITGVKDNFTAILPVLLPFAITVIVLFAAWYLIKGYAHRRA